MKLTNHEFTLDRLITLYQTIAVLEPNRVDLDQVWQKGKDPIKCGTAGCISGYAASLWGEYDLCYITNGLKILGIGPVEDGELAQRLYKSGYAHLFWFPHRKDMIDKEEALARLEIAIEFFREKASQVVAP